jgi:molybdopterin molybdotransferase
LLSVNDAIRQLTEAAEPPARTEIVALISALGRVLAEPVIASINVPPADNSAMDGYALIHEDWQKAGTPLPVSQRITAGAVPDHHIPGTAARIFTGAEGC